MGNPRSEPVHAAIEGLLQAVSEKGLGFKIEGEEKLLWLPKSQVASGSLHEIGEISLDELKKGDFVEWVEIPFWLMETNDLSEWEND